VATVRYFVHDIDAALPFYLDVLGFEVLERHGPAVAILGKGDLRLWLSGPPSSGARPMPDGRTPEPGGWNRFVVEVDDLEATVAGLTDAGVGFRNEIVTGPGGRQILAEDPSGNPIELFEPAARA
jgi:catechol 2,3-dioxygenase-like lactoylglutathione lyase family enzyme